MRARLIAAFAAVYITWGSTYLAIHYAVETLPPLLMAGTRFVIAGTILLLWARLRGGHRPTKADWITGLVGGVLLLAGGNGAVVWAEQLVPSGITALLVAVVPLWMVLLDWLRPGGQRPALPVFLSLGLGLMGLGLLVGPEALHGHGGGDVSLVGTGVLMVGALSWAVGSLYTRRAPRASSTNNGSGTQMLAGGVCLLLVGAVSGEPAKLDLANASAQSWIGFVYLITVGSLIGFTAYLYLLAHTTAAKAATYAYVNPVVAVFLGWLVAHEPVTSRTFVAAAVILASVAIITVTRDTRVRPVEAKRAAA